MNWKELTLRMEKLAKSLEKIEGAEENPVPYALLRATEQVAAELRRLAYEQTTGQRPVKRFAAHGT